jgi:hypothetical protein
MSKDFHHFVARGLFACKRGRPDTGLPISVLCGRVIKPDVDDWRKLVHYMKFVKGTADDVLTLSADNLSVIKWWVDASFAVHPDFKSHTGAVMKMGKGAILSVCMKQKLNGHSSCESELIGTDNSSVMILWTKLFMEAQGYRIKKNIVYQDNMSTLRLLKNGKRSSGKRTHALNIQYFFLHDQYEKGNVDFEYCPTEDMKADYNTKSKHGKAFRDMRKDMMGMH